MSGFLAISDVEMDPKCECTLCDTEGNKQASISEEELLKLFEPLVTKIELSKAQKNQPSKLSRISLQEETFNPVPVIKGQFLVVSAS